jgi:hypothetical protein
MSGVAVVGRVVLCKKKETAVAHALICPSRVRAPANGDG